MVLARRGIRDSPQTPGQQWHFAQNRGGGRLDTRCRQPLDLLRKWKNVHATLSRALEEQTRCHRATPTTRAFLAAHRRMSRTSVASVRRIYRATAGGELGQNPR
jgi:hypothetical protein